MIRNESTLTKKGKNAMKFLLTALNAKYIHSNPAIYSLRAYAGQELQPYIELAEYTINHSMQDILADLYRRQPRVIGFSCYIWNWDMIQMLLRELPKLLPHTHIWLGGPEVSYEAPGILSSYPQLQGIMIGEGEATFRELVEHYTNLPKQQTAEVISQQENAEAVSQQKNAETVSQQENAEAVLQQENAYTAWQQGLTRIRGLCLPDCVLPWGYTEARGLTDMNTLPFLYQDLEPFTNKILYYETSRGCPYRCSYCLSSIDKQVRFRDITIVERELQFFLDQRVSQVKFVDRTFNCNHEHAMAIWRYLYEHDNGVTNFHFEISGDILREDEIALLQKFRPGLAQLEIGVQSTNPKTLEAIHRIMNVEKLEGIVSAIRAGGNIHQHLDLIAGLPYEDYESFAQSFNRVYAMAPDQLQLGFLKVLKGSLMQERAEEYGIFYLDTPPYEVLYTKWLSYGDVLALKAVEQMVELYYNSGQYTHTLTFLERAFDHPFAMYEAMADFYREKGYFINSPARSYRYHVLLEFAMTYDGQHEDIYRELLTYDMYLREKLKSRPEFAYDISEGDTRERIRSWYRREERDRSVLPHYEAYDWKQLSRMTHMEPFCYRVWEPERIPREETARKEAKEATFLLFDYQKRNPLNYEAKTYHITAL